LVGNISFGVIDRGTSLLEVKPLTSCNLNCIYCSVSEGLSSTSHDFVVEQDYLVREVRRIVEFKDIEDVELHINSQGEPMLYSELTALVSQLSKIPRVSRISIDTNGVLLNRERAKQLIDAGMNQFNISLNALDQRIANEMAGTGYPVKQVLDVARYIASTNARLVLAPVLLPGYNDSEISKIIQLGKELGAVVAIQNFLEYKHGRRPVKQLSWKEFYKRLSQLEQEFDIKLKLTPKHFNIRPARSLPKVFKLGEVVKAKIICPGRYKNEVIVAARERNITVITPKRSGWVTFKIIRTKHNIYLGKAL